MIIIASSFGSSETSSRGAIATLLIPWFFREEIFNLLIPPMAKQGIFRSFVKALIFSTPRDSLFFFVKVGKTGPTPM